MTKKKSPGPQAVQDTPDPQAFRRFETLTKKLVSVPKTEVQRLRSRNPSAKK